ncbi:unnamed protein product [Brassica oleracea]|uniref:(rape) hypothetical protein n=1 Tax=Brassica napus TaxID=3708 RepID=A0A816JUB9_BRANA|nr:unnamed protein product [Brassica napus]
MKPNGKSPFTSDYDEKVMFFRDVSPGPHETQLRFRLIHFWEAWNPLKKTLIGLEMLLIDEQTVPPLLMKTDSDFIPLRIFKLTAIANETSTTPILDEVEIARARHVLVHVQSHEYSYPDFMSSSHVFMDYDVQPTIDWLGSNPQSAERVDAEVVTKRETLTIGEIYSYIKQGSTKVQLGGFFECTATIDDVVHGSTWYYISCSGCHTKATKDPTSLMCSKCGKVNIAGVAQYRAQISVYDNSEQVVFVLLGDAGYELTGKHALELVSSYFEVTFIIQYPQMLRTEVVELDCQANGNQGVTQEVHVPEALISTIGQKHNFCVKVTKHNLEGKSRSLTVTKILPLDTPAAT